MNTSDYKAGAVIEAGENWYLSNAGGEKSLSIVFDEVRHSHGEKIKNQPIKVGTRFVIESVNPGASSGHAGMGDSPTTAIVSELKKNGKFNEAAAKLTVTINQDWSNNTLIGHKGKIVGQMKQVFV